MGDNAQKSAPQGGKLIEAPPKAAPQLSPAPIANLLKTILSAVSGQKRNPVPNPQDPPWSYIALLNFFRAGKFKGHATGFFAGRDIVVTAAHNLRRTSPTGIAIFPGYDSELNRSSSLAGRSWASDSDRDVAIIVTSGKIASFFQFTDQLPNELTLAGYSELYPNQLARMTFATSPGIAIDQRIEYEMRVGLGDSGAPVFATGLSSAVAVHSKATLRTAGQKLIGIGEFASPEFLAATSLLEQRARSYLDQGTGT